MGRRWRRRRLLPVRWDAFGRGEHLRAAHGDTAYFPNGYFGGFWPDNNNGRGTYHLDGGVLEAGSIDVGAWYAPSSYLPNGEFVQTSGLNSIDTVINIGGPNEGTYSISDGTLQVRSGYVEVGSAGRGTLTLTGGQVSAPEIRLGPAGTISGNFTLTVPVTLNGGTINAPNVGDTLRFDAALIGTGRLTKTGPGRVVLGGGNTYSGGTTISAGTLQVGGGTGGSIIGDVIDNATLAFQPSVDCAYGGSISGSGNLVMAGAARLSLTASNSYLGGTRVCEGTLELANADALPSGRSLTIASGGHVVLASGLSHAISLGGLTITSGAATGSVAEDDARLALVESPAATPESSTLAILEAGAVSVGVYACWRRKRR